MSQEQRKQFLGVMLKKLNKIIVTGNNILNRISEIAKKTFNDKYKSDMFDRASLNERVQNRRFGAKLAADMIGVSHSLIYAAEKDGRLPDPDMRKDTARAVRAGYTINQINQMRDTFNTRPSKPEGSQVAISGMLNLKGGSQKTTNCLMFSQYLAMQGYKVLVVDTDPQGTLSFFYGKNPDTDVNYENTIAPYLLEDDEALVEAGLPPGSSNNLRYAIQKTYWNDVDIIPSCLQNLHIDLLMSRILSESGVGAEDALMKIRRGLLEIGGDYDFIVIDGTPSLNISTLNVISACDVVFIPTPASMPDFASTLKFNTLIEETFDSYMEEGIYPSVPDLRFFITKFTKSSDAEFMAEIIRTAFTSERGDVLLNEAKHSNEVGKAGSSINSIYEINPSDSDNSRKLKETVEDFNKLYEEMLAALCEACFNDSSINLNEL